MGKKNDGGPAYPFIGTMPATGVGNPVPTNVFHVGMKLRDWFAGQALAGLLARCSDLCVDPDLAAKAAHEHADSMLKARDKEDSNAS